MPDNAVYPLDEQLCFSLYAAHIAINRLYKPMLDRMGITYPQYLVLATLGENDGITIGAIAERLSLESSTITPPVKRLEQAGLVQRTRSKIDERQVHVSLSKAGWDMIGESKCLGDTLMERSGMTKSEFSAFNRQIRTFLKAVNTPA